MFTKNFKNMLAGFGMSMLNYSTSGITVKTRAGAKRYLSMANYASTYFYNISLSSSSSFTNGSTSASSTQTICLHYAVTTDGDGSGAQNRNGLKFSDSNGVTEDSYILPGTEFFPLSKFAITIKSRSMTTSENDVTFKIVYTLSSKVNTDTVIGSLGYYVPCSLCTTRGGTSTSYGQLLMIAIGLEEPVTIPANSAADLTVTIKANGQAWAEIT